MPLRDCHEAHDRNRRLGISSVECCQALQKYFSKFSSVLTLGPALYLYNLVSVLGVSSSHIFLGGLKYIFFAKSGHC